MVKKCYENCLTRDWQQCDHKNIPGTSHSTLHCMPGACSAHRNKRRTSVPTFFASVHLTTGKWREKKSYRASIENSTHDWKKPGLSLRIPHKRKKERAKKTQNAMEPNLYSNKTPSTTWTMMHPGKQQLNSFEEKIFYDPQGDSPARQGQILQT